MGGRKLSAFERVARGRVFVRSGRVLLQAQHQLAFVRQFDAVAMHFGDAGVERSLVQGVGRVEVGRLLLDVEY